MVEGVNHEGFGREKFDATFDELRSERDTVKSLRSYLEQKLFKKPLTFGEKERGFF